MTTPTPAQSYDTPPLEVVPVAWLDAGDRIHHEDTGCWLIVTAVGRCASSGLVRVAWYAEDDPTDAGSSLTYPETTASRAVEPQ